MGVTKYNDFKKSKSPSVEERYKIQMLVFKESLDKLKEIMVNNFSGNVTEMNWGHIGSLQSINDDLINIIEGWDEEFAKILKKKLEY